MVESRASDINVAVIGGTGLNQISGISKVTEHQILTDFGEPAAAIQELQLEVQGQAKNFYFLPRHGSPHKVAPHLINYRANIAALHQLGVKKIIAVNAVGSIDPSLQPKDLVMPLQVIDYTWGRESSFYDGTIRPLDHYDFSNPFDTGLINTIAAASESSQIALKVGGTYGVTQGPRLETAAEIRRMAQDGATLVGMTLMPEAVLAHELQMAYASICLVVNPAAGVSDNIITMADIQRAIDDGMDNAKSLIKFVLKELCQEFRA